VANFQGGSAIRRLPYAGCPNPAWPGAAAQASAFSSAALGFGAGVMAGAVSVISKAYDVFCNQAACSSTEQARLYSTVQPRAR
jgi:hypothetical protein